MVTLGGSVFARLTYLEGKLTYEVASADTNARLLSANRKYYYDPTMFDAGVVDRDNRSTNVRLALRDLDQTASALGTGKYDGQSAATTDDYASYSLATGSVNGNSRGGIPRHLNVVRSRPYEPATSRAPAYDASSDFETPNRIVRHGATVKEALEAINEAIGDVGKSGEFQYMGTFSVDWIDDKSTIKACFEQIVSKVEAIEVPDLGDTRRRLDGLDEKTTKTRTDLDNEIARAVKKDGELHVEIKAEETRAIRKELLIEADLVKEETRAKTREDGLQGSIEAEASRAKGREAEIESKVQKETTRATEEEVRIESRVAQEISRATARDDELEGMVNAEKTRAQDAERKVADDLQEETSRAKQKEEANALAVETEKSRALLREGEIATSVGTERERAVGRENAIEEKVDAEIARATGVENGILTNAIPAVDAKAEKNKADLIVRKEEIDQEAQAREALDTRLTAKTDALQGTVDQLNVATGFVGDLSATTIAPPPGTVTAAVEAVHVMVKAEATRAKDEEEALGTRIDSVGKRIDRILSNTDGAALDSLTEIASAFQTADQGLVQNVETLTKTSQDDRDAIRSIATANRLVIGDHVALKTTANTVLAAINELVDEQNDLPSNAATKAEVQAVEAKVTAVRNRVDGVEPCLGVVEGDLESLESNLQAATSQSANERGLLRGDIDKNRNDILELKVQTLDSLPWVGDIAPTTDVNVGAPEARVRQLFLSGGVGRGPRLRHADCGAPEKRCSGGRRGKWRDRRGRPSLWRKQSGRVAPLLQGPYWERHRGAQPVRRPQRL